MVNHLTLCEYPVVNCPVMNNQKAGFFPEKKRKALGHWALCPFGECARRNILNFIVFYIWCSLNDLKQHFNGAI